MFNLRKRQWLPPAREAFIEDEGDAFQVMLFEGGDQIGCCFIPDDGTGSGFDLAQSIASDWLTYNDRMRSDRRGMGRRPPHIDNGPIKPRHR